MRTAEIQYVVPDGPTNQSDHEKILVAMSAYQDELPIAAANTVEINQDKDNKVVIKLFQRITSTQGQLDIHEIAEQMRMGVERHFESEDLMHLSKRFAQPETTDALDS